MILIVGATGDLGGHVARQLLEQGHRVRAMTRDPRRAAVLAAAGAAHVALPVLRVLSRLAQPIHSGVSRIMQMGVVTETTDQRFDSARSLARYPVVLTRLEDWARVRIAAR